MILSNKKNKLIDHLKRRKKAIAWKILDIKGINPSFWSHKILMEEKSKPTIQPQRRMNLKVQEVVRKEVFKLLDVGMIYQILDSPWVSLIHIVPNKVGMTIIANEKYELILERRVIEKESMHRLSKTKGSNSKRPFPTHSYINF